jgi:ribonuclease-3
MMMEMCMGDSAFENLQKRLGYKFKDADLLVSALTHSSFANEKKGGGKDDNERLEFLGDSVLGMAVSAMIYTKMADLSEGEMTKLRAELVCERSLSALAGVFSLGDCLQLGRGEEKSGGRGRPSILADAVEAVIAAMYLDGGLRPVTRFVKKHLWPRVADARVGAADHKTMLQEAVQAKSGMSLTYHVVGESGPDHLKTFTVEVMLGGAVIGRGEGLTKKAAEQDAARTALAKM